MSTVNKLYQIFSSLFYNTKSTGDNNNEVLKDTPVEKSILGEKIEAVRSNWLNELNQPSQPSQHSTTFEKGKKGIKVAAEIKSDGSINTIWYGEKPIEEVKYIRVENTEEMVEGDDVNDKIGKWEAELLKGGKIEAKNNKIEVDEKNEKGEAKDNKEAKNNRGSKNNRGEAKTVLDHKELENLYDFTFEAYCEFRSKVIENEPTIDDLAQALCVLYNNDTLSMWEVNDLLDLYNSTIQMINDYQPTNVLTWNGYEVVPPELNPITVGESITLLEFDRRAGKILDKDYNANIDFNLGLEQFAVLLRKPGEHLPIDLNKRIKFIDARKQIAKQAPLWLILNVRFFFIRKYRKSLIKSVLSTYLTMTSQ